ncbi:hypothetical protein OAZ20_04620 [Paracoccaceae bacterium]|nr:hypothetical protein [Paracoccaceae bacterium]
MTKLLNYISFFFLAGLLTGCSQVLQTVNLDVNAEDNSVQETFNVVEKTLTIKEAKAQKNAKYYRMVIRSGRGENAQPIPENLALVSEFPKNESPKEYILGIGDTVSFSRLIENNRSNDEIESQWPIERRASSYKLGIGDTLALTLIKKIKSNTQLVPSNADQNVFITSEQVEETIESTGRIGSDGSVLLLEVGRLEAAGKSLNELRSEVRNILIRNGVSPRFQLEIAEFQSQKAYLTVNAISTVVSLNDQITTLKDILTSANVGFTPGVITLIRLNRDGKEFSILLRDLYSNKAANINVQSGDHIFIEDSLANIRTTASIIDNEGYLVFENVGKVKAAGRTLNELKKDVESLMQPVPHSQNAFQVEITKFASQKALVTPHGKPGVLIPITNTPAKLSEVLTQNGLSIDENSITQISLRREGQIYKFSLDDLLDSDETSIYLQPGDHISAQVLPYKENKVFILGGVSPQIFKINPANRETLADVLFTSGGPLSASSAKRSEVYLLRGSNPVVAYHLDAQSPTRLIVADAMELRPNDILYVAEQPIISFNRALATIVPLRILLRDIQDENIP